MAREYAVVRRLRTAVEAASGVCQQHVNNGVRGDPDQLVSFPWGYHCLVECKWRTGVRPQAHQRRRHEYWRDHGMDVWVVTDERDIRGLIVYAFHTQSISVPRRPVASGPSPRHAGGRSRPRKNGNNAASAGDSSSDGQSVLSGADTSTEARS